MQHPTEKKNLTQLEVIELLTLLKTESENTIAKSMGIVQSTVHYYKKKYGAFTPKIIDRVIIQLQRDAIEDKTDYEKCELCTPKKFYFKCHDCGFVSSENNIQGIRDHLDKYEGNHRLLTVQTI